MKVHYRQRLLELMETFLRELEEDGEKLPGDRLRLANDLTNIAATEPHTPMAERQPINRTQFEIQRAARLRAYEEKLAAERRRQFPNSGLPRSDHYWQPLKPPVNFYLDRPPKIRK